MTGFFDSNGRVLRHRILSRLQPPALANEPAWVVAPVGFGKTTVGDQLLAAAKADGHVVGRVSVDAAANHLGLFVDALADSLKGTTGIAPLLASRGDSAEWLRDALGASIDASRKATVVVDDIHALGPGDLADALAALLGSAPANVTLVLVGRFVPTSLASMVAEVSVGPAELAFSGEELVALTGGALHGRTLQAATHGWPILAAQLRDATVGGTAAAPVAPKELVDELLSALRPEVVWLAKVASVLATSDLEAVQALFSSSVPGSPAAKRRLAPIPPGRVGEALEAMRNASVISHGPSGVGIAPALRRGLSASLKHSHPEVFLEANRRAAELSIAGGEIHPSAYDYFLAAGAHDRVRDVLEARAEGFFANDEPALRRWLEALEERSGAIPHWVSYYLGRLLARAGEWEGATARLESAREAIATDSGVHDWWWQPRICVAFGEMLSLRGAHAESRTWCRRGADYLDTADRKGLIPEEGRQDTAEVKLEIAVLLGRVTMAVGNAGRSAELLGEALEQAQAINHGETIDELLVLLATNAARAGDTEACERFVATGLARGQEATAPRLLATRALARAYIGRWEAGREDLDNAIAGAGQLAEAETLRHVHLYAGRFEWLAGDVAAAVKQLEEAESVAGAMTDVCGRGQVYDQLALLLIANDTARARQLHELSASLIGGVLRMDGYLAGLHAEVTAELRLSREGVPNKGIRYVEVARDSYVRFGAQYDVARLHLRQAQLHHAQVVAGEDEGREPVLTHLNAFVANAGESGFALTYHADDAQLWMIAARWGDEAHRGFVEEQLTKVGVDLEVLQPEAERIAQRYDALRSGVSLDKPFRVTTRDAVVPASAEEIAGLVEQDGNSALVVLVGEQSLVNYGKEIPLGQKRVILPLLLHFLHNHAEAFTMAELARSIWGADEVTSSIQTKVKVAVSRLRSLLGKARNYVVTTRKDEDGKSVVAYTLAPGLRFVVVEDTSAN